jgi:MFS transporter, OPA family, glycerol-3-phosphate transporter
VSRDVSPMRMAWVLALTYGAFYFCRANISAAVPGIKAELHLDNTDIGFVLGTSKLVYGIGQFVNGQMAEQVSPKRMLAIGMLGSAALNVVFGFGSGLSFLVFVWACNGFAQALGWTPTMRVAANWLAPHERGRAIGVIGTGYQIAAALTYVVAGTAVDTLGWRGALWLPAAMLAACSIVMLVELREHPPASATAEPRERAPRISGADMLRNVGLTLRNPALWLLAIALGCLNANRYGFIDWGITHVTTVQEGTISEAAIEYAVLPTGGVAGALFSGWASDKFFRGRRAPVIVGLLVGLALLTLVYHRAVMAGLVPTVAVLLAVGFTLFGAQVLLVGTAPVDLARPGTQAAAVGFVNFMGYMGAYAGDLVTGRIADVHGWSAAVDFWAVCAGGAAISAALLWNRRG